MITIMDLERIGRLSNGIEINADYPPGIRITVRIAVLVGGLNVWATGEADNIDDAWDAAVVEMVRLR